MDILLTLFAHCSSRKLSNRLSIQGKTKPFSQTEEARKAKTSLYQTKYINHWPTLE